MRNEYRILNSSIHNFIQVLCLTRNFKMNRLILVCFTLTVVLFSFQVKGQESGECSYYGDPGEIPEGHPTACGEGFQRMAMKGAHKQLPCGTRIRVRNKSNGKTVDITINDRGPFVAGRIVDLTYGAFGQVEQHSKGVFPCDFTVL